MKKIGLLSSVCGLTIFLATGCLDVAEAKRSILSPRKNFSNKNLVVQWQASTQSVSEGSGTVQATAVLEPASTESISIPYTISGSASSPNDHNAVNGTLSIPAGSTTASVSIAIVNDTLVEGAETLVLTMGTPVGADLGTTINLTITIQDNDVVAPSPTPSPTISPKPSPTPSPTVSPKPSPTPSPTVSPKPSPTPSPTISPRPSPTPSPSETSDLPATKTMSLSQLITAQSSLLPGDVVELTDGTYSNIRLTLSVSGTADRPILIRARNPGKVVVTGASNIFVRGSYVTLKGFFFKDVKHTTISSSTTYNVVLFDRVSHSSIQDSAFIRCGTLEKRAWHIIQVRSSDNVLIKGNMMVDNKAVGMGYWMHSYEYTTLHSNKFIGNYFKDITNNGFSNTMESIQLGTGYETDGTTFQTSEQYAKSLVEGNLFDHANGDGEVISVKTSQNILRNNVFVSSQELVLRCGHENLVENNYFKNNRGCIRVAGSDHIVRGNYCESPVERGLYVHEETSMYQPVENLTVINNTFLNPGLHGLRLRGGANNRIENNKLYTNVGYGVYWTAGGFSFSGNTFFREGSTSLYASLRPSSGVTVANPGITPKPQPFTASDIIRPEILSLFGN